MNGLEIQDLELVDDGKTLTLRVHVHNGASQTLFAYGNLRGARYDPASKTLDVLLTDRGLAERLHSNFILPKLVSIDAGATTSIEVTVPRVIARFAAGAHQISPVIERLQAHEAETVTVEMAWGDTPFYRDPRQGPTQRKHLVAWAKGFATYRKPRGGGPGQAGALPPEGGDDGGQGDVPDEPPRPKGGPRKKNRR